MSTLAARILVSAELKRRTLESRLPAVAEVINREIPSVLGEAAPPASRPGEAPHRRTGDLLRRTRAVVGPDGAVHLLTTVVGVVLDAGRRDGSIKARPWKKTLLDRTAAARRAALFGR